jgi:hypothetical protein
LTVSASDSKVRLGAEARERGADGARAGDADVQDGLGLARAEVRPRDERVVLDGVAEADELRAADRAAGLGRPRGVEDDAREAVHGVHVDAGARRGERHGGAHVVRLRQGPRDRAEQGLVAVREPLVDVGREAPDEIHPDGRRRGVHRAGEGDEVLDVRRGRHERDRGRRDALVHDRDPVVGLDRVGHRDEVLRVVDDLGVDLLAGALDVRVGAVEQVDPERRRADVERLELDHPDGLEDLLVGEGSHAGAQSSVSIPKCSTAREMRETRDGCRRSPSLGARRQHESRPLLAAQGRTNGRAAAELPT